MAISGRGKFPFTTVWMRKSKSRRGVGDPSLLFRTYKAREYMLTDFFFGPQAVSIHAENLVGSTAPICVISSGRAADAVGF